MQNEVALFIYDLMKINHSLLDEKSSLLTKFYGLATAGISSKNFRNKAINIFCKHQNSYSFVSVASFVIESIDKQTFILLSWGVIFFAKLF